VCWGIVMMTQEKILEEGNRRCAMAFLLQVIKYLPTLLDHDLLDMAMLLDHDLIDVTMLLDQE
jgi:hypothetical protein